jgi:ABC-type uncharacterized transport system permease subunit
MKAVAATMRAAFAEAIANRQAFWTQIAAMTVNDVAWVTFWPLFFDQVGEVGGWSRHDVLVLLAVLTVAGGLVLGLFSNTRRVGQLINDGGLDAILALPVRPLPVLLVRRVDPVNFGDVLFGCCLYAATGPDSLGARPSAPPSPPMSPSRCAGSTPCGTTSRSTSRSTSRPRAGWLVPARL